MWSYHVRKIIQKFINLPKKNDSESSQRPMPPRRRPPGRKPPGRKPPGRKPPHEEMNSESL
jgi:hypothetical protein